MGDRDVDRIIEQWRAEAQATGESAPPPQGAGETGRARRLARRIGWPRLAGAAAALLLFVLVAVPVLGAGDAATVSTVPDGSSGESQALEDSGGPSAEPLVPDGAAGPSAEPLEDSGGPSAEPLVPGGPSAEPLVPGGPSAEPLVPDGAAAAAPDGLAPGPVDDWFDVIRSVDEARAAAYATGDAGGLGAVFTPDGPALAHEQATVAALAADKVRAIGWRTDLLSVRVVERSVDTVALAVRDRRGSYDLVGPTGAVTTVPAAGAAEWLVSVRKSADRWQVVDVAAQP